MAKTILKDDGERMIPEHHKNNLVYGEHIIRYEAARDLVKDQVVLDIACGSGYGTAVLSENATKVYGVDIDEETISYARENYGRKNIEYIVGSATKIPLPDDCVDVVVTYETIEHIKDYKKFLVETKRVLKKDGLILVSTPNDIEFIEGNHFHIHEFEYKELIDLLGKYFKNTKSWMQGDWLSSGILSIEQMNSEWEQSIKTINVSPKSVDKSIYFFILCSDRKITEKVTPLFSLSEHWSTRNAQEQENVKTQKIEMLLKSLESKDQEIANANRQIDDTNQELSLIKGSRKWRLVQKMAKVQSGVNKINRHRK